MGFFKKVGGYIGKKIENFGNFVGSEKISNFGRSVQDACAEKVSHEKSYEKKEANIYTTERLNEILFSFSEGYLQQAITMENSCVKWVENYYQAIIELLEESSDHIRKGVNIKRVRNSKSKIRENIKGAIKIPLSKRMSLDDAECLNILKMEAGTEKQRAMTKYSQKIIDDALSNLAAKVRQTLDDQMEEIEDFLIDLSEEQEIEYSNLKKQYEEIIKDLAGKESNSEKSCIKPLITIESAKLIHNLLV